YEIAPLEGGKSGGLARVAGLLRQLEAENPNTIAVLAGDFLSPSFMGNLKMDDGERIAGLQMVETLNALGLDYATFGNHEFDLKTLDLVEKRVSQSTFQYMTCNALAVEADKQRPFQQGEEAVPEYLVHTFGEGANSLKLAFVGVVLPFNQQDYVHYEDVTTSFATAVKAARGEADVVLGLTHLNLEDDEALAAAVPGLPLFIGGHEHHHLTSKIGATTITKADANAKTVYIHRFRHDPSSGQTTFTSELIPITADTPTDPETEAVVKNWQDRLDGLIADMGYDPHQKLTTLKEPLQGTEAAIRSKQTNYGKLTNEAFQSMMPGADVYCFNGGSLRVDDNLSGTITTFDILRSFPYGGPIVKMEMNGRQLDSLLTIGQTINVGKGGYLQRLGAERGRHAWIINGRPLEEKQTYQVILPKFVADGREANLEFLGPIPYVSPAQFTPRGGPVKNDIRDILVYYLGH
ncbi:MAG: bifunctional metallophosphatase/5'-nucleotidase, partial [Bacteroidota bacterium]